MISSKLFADEKRVSINNLDKRSGGDNANAWSGGDEKMLFKSGVY